MSEYPYSTDELEKTCRWKQPDYDDVDYGRWHTDCGEYFCLTEGSPKENEFSHCPYCGKRLTEIPYREADPPT